MQFRAYVGAAVVLCVTMFFLCATQAAGALPMSQATNGKVFLDGYLVAMGVHLDCYFTLERDQTNKGKFSSLSTAFVRDDQAIETVDELIVKLQKEVPGLTVVQDKQNPAIVHLIETSLTRVRNYPMDDNVNLKYSGSLAGLPSEIGARSKNGLQERLTALSSDLYDDQFTQVQVKGGERSARQLLTDYIALSQYSRILWSAETRQTDGARKTSVQYPGSSWNGATLQRTKSLPTQPFSKGEVAYIVNPKSDALISDAIAFIDAQMNSKEPRQVRWAMFYLGKYKVEKGIPVLLKYIDYRYTTVPLMEEAFPALRALTDIGKPASKAALKLIATETNPQRLELLSRVVLNVDGPEVGRANIESVADAVTDAVQKQKIKDALAAAQQ